MTASLQTLKLIGPLFGGGRRVIHAQTKFKVNNLQQRASGWSTVPGTLLSL